MPKTENQNVTSGRDQLLERAARRFPDRRFVGQIGQDGQDGTDDLENAIIEMLDEQGAKIDEYNSKNEELLKLLASDPRCADFIAKWVNYGDPRAALVEVFGDDLAELATEEGRNAFGERLAEWRGRKAEAEKMDAEADENWKKSLEDLDSWGNAKGLDNDQKAQVIARLIGVTAGGIQNIYTVDDFNMVFKETNFDNAVKTARQEGEVAGRNAKINEERRTRTTGAVLPPAMGGGQGMRVPADKPQKERNIWDEI